MTSNIAESMNAANNAARHLLVTPLVECLRSLTQNWSWKHKSEALALGTKLATKPNKILTQNYVESTRMKVQQASEIIFKAIEGTNSFEVNLEEKTCSCNRFQMDELPCSHAMAVFAKKHLSSYDYCSKYYKKETMLATYEGTVHPVGNPKEWTIPNSISEIKLKTPKGKRKAGRPKKKRIPSAGEPKAKTRCGRCKEYGHNRVTCRNPPVSEAKRSKNN
ncbi:Zinc finger, PMZ-type [Trema orientale]|uniref:Zinc finger, PMZ-type n=1 Tax=Trema orientale TaxID=63057 RepID=A0A2P5CAJ9_TREOI|nr:Zinc finger, PMZ-type [Trema orientale]